MFTYLHVSDSYRPPGRVSEVTSPPRAEGQDFTASDHSSSILSQNLTPEGGTASSHNRFKACSLFNLKEPIKSKEKELWRNSTLGLERSGKPPSIFRRRCNTWPEGERRAQENQSTSKLQVFIKQNMLPVDSVIDNKSNPFPKDYLPNAVKTSSGAVKNICSYLSLGSTLSFSLPKHFNRNVLDMENKGEIEPIHDYHDQTTQPPKLEHEIKPVAHMKQTEATLHTVHIEDLENTEEIQTQQLSKSYESTVSRDFKSVACEEPDTSSQHVVSPPVVNGSSSVTQCRSMCPSSFDHTCFSVYTKIKDLNGHLYYSSKYMKVNPNGLSSSKSGRIINCGVQDCAVCVIDTEKADICMEELLQPGHWLFQQEEEELEDIWRGRVGNSNYAEETIHDEKTGRRGLSK